jgi:hypothetical protein
MGRGEILKAPHDPAGRHNFSAPHLRGLKGKAPERHSLRRMNELINRNRLAQAKFEKWKVPEYQELVGIIYDRYHHYPHFKVSVDLSFFALSFIPILASDVVYRQISVNRSRGFESKTVVSQLGDISPELSMERSAYLVSRWKGFKASHSANVRMCQILWLFLQVDESQSEF